MRLTVLALTACLLATPAFAQDAIKFPEKLDAKAAGYQMAYSDVGPVYVAGQPSEQAIRDLKDKGVKTIINLRTQPEMDNRRAVPFDEAALTKERSPCGRRVGRAFGDFIDRPAIPDRRRRHWSTNVERSREANADHARLGGQEMVHRERRRRRGGVRPAPRRRGRKPGRVGVGE